jgi:hypothetical protein
MAGPAENASRAITSPDPFLKVAATMGLSPIPKIKAIRNASHGKKHTENTGKKLFSVFSVRFSVAAKGPK